jgi:prevent-host-death family protein
MRQVNMHEAKTQLSRLVEAVASGDEQEVIIARDGTPRARIVPIEPAKKNKVRLGLAEGRFPSMSLEEFNSHDEEIAALFYGEAT